MDRLSARRETARASWRLDSVLFPPQLALVRDTARYVTAVCTRRAGKSYACAALLLETARAKPGGVCLYLTLSRLNARRLLWAQLLALNAQHGLGGVAHEAELCLSMPTGARIYLSGAADEGEIEKFRGLPLSVAVIDEAQSFPAYISRLVDEVLAPALMDYSGRLVLVGTPGPVPVGYYHDAAHSPAWSHHRWSVADNPHVERLSGRTFRQLLADELERRGVTEEDPVILREWFGAWVVDTHSLVFAWNSERNGRPPRQCQHHVVAVDLGWDDSDAIAVLGWRDDSPEVDLVYEWVGSRQGVTALMERVKVAYETYSPLAVVADTGGLGRKIAEEITQRTGIPVEAAEKERKHEHIELLNDALRTRRMFAPATSRFAEDCLKVEWDRSNPEKPKISERFHSDICDAVLYGWRRALAWLHVPQEPAPPPRGTPEWYTVQQRQQEEELEAQFEEQFEANRRRQQEQEESDLWV